MAEWGTAKVRGKEIRRETTYMVHAECDFPGGAVLSSAASAKTWTWGDVDYNGIVNAIDVANLVNAFKGIFGPFTFEQMNLFGCVPDPVINALDIVVVVDAVKGFSYPCPVICPCTDAADIRADLNGDGVIDAGDDALEESGDTIPISLAVGASKEANAAAAGRD